MPTKTATSARPARQRRGSDSTRVRILVQAERLFADRGFNGVTMPAIAEASGITAGAIYRHFKSKAELFFLVVRRAVETAPISPEASLPEIVSTYTSRRLLRVRQIAVEVHYAAARDPAVRRLLRRSVDLQIAAISENVAAAQRTGALGANADAGLVASAVMVFIMGLMHLETLDPKLVGDPRWEVFVRDHVAALIGEG
ncbi:helix-turn-helix domain-containing protein [Phenylobacterium sp.]|uniref:TetR/AcrR family transcriptional regulator n=1 Tax=Phenylobacterium sp. TaxID=1871053 RepID=UPI002F41E27C